MLLQAFRSHPWLLLTPVLLAGCAQAAIDADAALFDLVDDDADAEEGDASSGDASSPFEPDASVYDASVDASGTPDAAGDAGNTGDAGMEAGVDANTPPDAGPECFAGTYKGAFEGTITVIGIIGIEITGDVTIDVETNSTGDRLELNNGRVVGEDQDGNPLEAKVTGTLNCVTGLLEGGKLEEGKYTRPITGVVNFEGVVTAEYTSDPPQATGTWETNGGLLESGEGTWGAMLVR